MVIKYVKGGAKMAVLDGFTTFNFSEGVPYVSVTSNGVTFNKSVVMTMGYPKYVVLLIDESGKRIAVQECEETTPNATEFYKQKKSDVISVRWNGKDLLNTLQDMMGWKLDKNGGFRVSGTHLKDEKAMLFDLNTATELK